MGVLRPTRESKGIARRRPTECRPLRKRRRAPIFVPRWGYPLRGTRSEKPSRALGSPVRTTTRLRLGREGGSKGKLLIGRPRLSWHKLPDAPFFGVCGATPRHLMPLAKRTVARLGHTAVRLTPIWVWRPMRTPMWRDKCSFCRIPRLGYSGSAPTIPSLARKRKGQSGGAPHFHGPLGPRAGSSETPAPTTGAGDRRSRLGKPTTLVLSAVPLTRLMRATAD